MQHMCAVCHSIREATGQFSRITVNHDAVLLAVLAHELGQREVAYRTVGLCVLRTAKTQTTLGTEEPCIRFAAATSLLMAGAALTDHIRDREGVGRLPGMDALAQHWMREAYEALGGMGIETAGIDAALRSIEELSESDSLEAHVCATGRLYGLVCAGVAVISGRVDLVASLSTVGQCLGEIAFISDALDDLERDRAKGRVNPLLNCVAPRQVGVHQLRLAAERLVLATESLHLPDESVASIVLRDLATTHLDDVVQPAPARSSFALVAAPLFAALAAPRRGDEPFFESNSQRRVQACNRRCRKCDYFF